ncbi:uncharacterized protein PHALS_06307 [Plasmopara halstedii]|uniref:Uncharacterized protein n=1 Tax=Plasmopara halstedii TaxID=4781 RepID=A0A0P1B3N3_PLAHL|nr:uncharacterized protein PHALS_06307 [Plasmopara halstedii]CEG48488.1 hypothetical protein PHALS_06307 [Plasmopara halstedii]|eukprot:XP_024584857.1 hypothetical protein PHALS_06307 [Plasmopara halstedii]
MAIATHERNDSEIRRKLQDTSVSLSSWIDSDDHKLLPRHLRPSVVCLLSEAIDTAESPHTSIHSLKDTLALTECGATYLTSLSHDKGTLQRLDTIKSQSEKDRSRLIAKAETFVHKWKRQRFPLHGMPSLQLKTSSYLIPTVQALQESTIRPTAELN